MYIIYELRTGYHLNGYEHSSLRQLRLIRSSK